MRQQRGHYGGDPSANSYAATQMHHMPGQRTTTSRRYEGPLEVFTPERDDPYTDPKLEGQWRFGMEGSNMPNLMASSVFNEGQGGDASRSYFQGLRQDSNLPFQNQSGNDARTQAQEDDMNVGYEGDPSSHSFESLEQKFQDEILKLAKEQNDAEDSENARHREKINSINAQYDEKLAELRAQHATRRDEFLKRESRARQQQYQQNIRDAHPSIGMAPNHNPHGYSPADASAAAGDARRGYPADPFESYQERGQFLGNGRDHQFGPRGPYPGLRGRLYDTGSRRYYN